MLDKMVTTQYNKFWEVIQTDGVVQTSRGKVPGGWLVQQTFIAPMNRDDSKLGDIVFVADELHVWIMKSEFK